MPHLFHHLTDVVYLQYHFHGDDFILSIMCESVCFWKQIARTRTSISEDCITTDEHEITNAEITFDTHGVSVDGVRHVVSSTSKHVSEVLAVLELFCKGQLMSGHQLEHVLGHIVLFAAWCTAAFCCL